MTNKRLFLWSCHHILWTPLRQVVILWYLITSWFSLCLYLGKLILVFPEYPLHFHIFSQGTWWNGREIPYCTSHLQLLHIFIQTCNHNDISNGSTLNMIIPTFEYHTWKLLQWEVPNQRSRMSVYLTHESNLWSLESLHFDRFQDVRPWPKGLCWHKIRDPTKIPNGWF